MAKQVPLVQRLKRKMSRANVSLKLFLTRKWRRWSACYGNQNHDPVIQVYREEDDHGFQFGNCDDSTNSGEVSVWKKNIVMGGKCQLPDFSGVIIYDSIGNVVTPPKPSTAPLALTWK